MLLRWDQSAGVMTLDDKIIGRGYAGRGRGVNNPAMQAAPQVGPLPRGRYKLTEVKDSPNTGKFSIVLEPLPRTQMFGRSLFRIHGDNAKLNRTASHGCIILPRNVREVIWRSGCRVLEVVE